MEPPFISINTYFSALYIVFKKTDALLRIKLIKPEKNDQKQLFLAK